MFKKKQHSTYFMMAILVVSPIIYYRYRKELHEFLQRNFMKAPKKLKEKSESLNH